MLVNKPITLKCLERHYVTVCVSHPVTQARQLKSFHFFPGVAVSHPPRWPEDQGFSQSDLKSGSGFRHTHQHGSLLQIHLKHMGNA